MVLFKKRRSSLPPNMRINLNSDNKAVAHKEGLLKDLYASYLNNLDNKKLLGEVEHEIDSISSSFKSDYAEWKWNKWEEANEAANKQALAEITQKLGKPDVFNLEAIAEDEIFYPPSSPSLLGSDLGRLKSRQDDIMLLFSKTSEQIAKIHHADLLYKFNYLNLGVMELRALLALVPKNFSISEDPLQHKSEWRKQVRQRLYDKLSAEIELRSIQDEKQKCG